MKSHSPIKMLIVAVLLILPAVFSPPIMSVAQQRGEQAVKQELQTEIGMPILAGDLWQKMTHDDKIAFVWGFWHVVSIERYLMEKYPQLQNQNFSAKVVEASHKDPMTANQIVALIDDYYRSHPDEIKKPVVGVLWDEMIRPNITAGIAGRPLAMNR